MICITVTMGTQHLHVSSNVMIKLQNPKDIKHVN